MTCACDKCGRGPFPIAFWGKYCFRPIDGVCCGGRLLVKKLELHETDENAAYEHERDRRSEIGFLGGKHIRETW